MTEERHHARTCAEYAEEQAERLRLARERYCRAVRQHFDLLREAPAGDPGGIETLDLLEQRDRERWPAQQPCDEWSVGDCIADAEELERENQDLHKIPAEIRRYLKDPQAAPDHLREAVEEAVEESFKPQRGAVDVFDTGDDQDLPF